MAGNNEVEGSRFARKVEEIEKLIRAGGMTSGGSSLAALLQTAEARLEETRMEDQQFGPDTKNKKERDHNAAIAHMVEREHKLNQKEREQYARFLEMEYFRRKDLDQLAAFYADGGGYDKLSEEGKIQMSQRIEKGIERGEFTRDDLPAEVSRKNNEIRSRSEGAPQEISPAKSASLEADSSKKTNSGEKKQPDADRVLEESTDQALAFSDDARSVSPTEIRRPTGAGHAI